MDGELKGNRTSRVQEAGFMGQGLQKKRGTGDRERETGKGKQGTGG
jgi:hypothetical protein